MSDSDNMPQVFTRKFNRKSSRPAGNGREELNGFIDEEPEEIDQPRTCVTESPMTPGEKKAAMYTLYFTLSILFLKLIFGNHVLNTDFAKSAQSKCKPICAHSSLTPITPDWLGETLFTIQSAWRGLRLIVLPVLWCLFFTFYTWFIVFKNIAEVYGIATPTPLSPTRHRDANVGGAFYLDYCLPLGISFGGFLLMLYLSHL